MRTLAMINQEYTALCSESGDIHFKTKLNAERLKAIELKLLDLNTEGEKLHKRAQAAAKTKTKTKGPAHVKE